MADFSQISALQAASVVALHDEHTPSGPEGLAQAQQARTAALVSESLQIAVGRAGAGVFEQDSELRLRWAANLPRSWPQPVLGGDERHFLPSSQADKLMALKKQVLFDGQPALCELTVETPHGVESYDARIDLRRDADGVVCGVVTTLLDTTDHKQRERSLRLLLREVSHRSKNLLAIIQAIASQTGRHSETIDGFLEKFRGRLQSLAMSQDLVTLSNWRGADLAELVRNQIDRFMAGLRGRVLFDGANPHLNPNAALHIGLALHELCSNSVNYGILSRPDGVVRVQTGYEPDQQGQRMFVLTWMEPMIQAEETFANRKFGSVTLERVVPISLKGEAQLILEDGQLLYRLLVPAASIGVAANG